MIPVLDQLHDSYGVVGTGFFVGLKQLDKRSAIAMGQSLKLTSAQEVTGSSGVINQLYDDVEDEVVLFPSQDYGNGVMYFAVKRAKKLHLLTSERECFPIEECESKNIKLIGLPDRCRLSSRSLHAYLAGEMVTNSALLFAEISEYLKRFVILKDADCYSFLALWIMGTYIFRVFRYYPYIHLAGEKQSGKTLLMEIMSTIAFNGEISASATAAVLFRDVQSNQPTLFLDEVERLRTQDRERFGAVLEVLNTGYAKTGLVKRVGGKNFDTVHSFSTFSPKVFAGINGVHDVLADRAIPILMVRRLAEESVERYRETKVNLETHRRIRDELYVFALSYGPQIGEAYSSATDEIPGLEHLSNREYDIWSPIFAVAQCVDESTGKTECREALIRLSVKKLEERREFDESENMTSKVLRVLNTLVKDVKPMSVEGTKLTYLTEKVYQLFRHQGDCFEMRHKTTLTRRLRSVGVEVLVKNVRGRSHRVYVIDRLVQEDFTKRYLGTGTISPDDEDVV